MTDEEDDEPIDFLQSMMCGLDTSNNIDEEDDDDCDPNHPTETIAAATTTPEPGYNSRKPLWWKKLSGKPTKGQKRAMTAMAAWRLPKVPWGEYLDWTTIFPQPQQQHQDESEASSSQEIWLEIGFGNGDNLLALAERHPQRLFVGAEVHNPGIGKVCQRMLQALQNDRYWNEYVEFSDDKANRPKNTTIVEDGASDEGKAATINQHDKSILPSKPTIPEGGYTPFNTNFYSNLRIHGGDGVKLLPYIPSHSLAVVLVTFPDPFPKDTQLQFRVLQKHTLLEIHRILRPSDGRLFLATDHEGHHAWCHATVDQVNQDDSQDCHNDNNTATGGTTWEKAGDQPRQLFDAVEITDRTEWLPVISKYEQKGWNEGRQTHLSCWKAIKDNSVLNEAYSRSADGV